MSVHSWNLYKMALSYHYEITSSCPVITIKSILFCNQPEVFIFTGACSYGYISQLMFCILFGEYGLILLLLIGG